MKAIQSGAVRDTRETGASRSGLDMFFHEKTCLASHLEVWFRVSCAFVFWGLGGEVVGVWRSMSMYHYIDLNPPNPKALTP